MRLHCDVEFAHHESNPADWAIERAEVRRSAEITQDLLELLSAAKLTWSTSVLVDDKRSIAVPNVRRALDNVGQLLGPVPVNRAMLESELIRLTEPFIEHFDRRRASRIQTDFLAYRQRAGQLGCSHDISIWYAVRGGLLTFDDIAARLPEGSHFGFDQVVDPITLVSVLPARVANYERRAQTSVLKHLVGAPQVSNDVVRIYFDVDRPTGPVRRRLADAVRQVASNVGVSS